jgi:molybdopterin-guanine dinucleotide biosynthesis protein A
VEKLGIPVYASINSSQLNSYLSIFNQERCITDSVDTKGPLTGLISAWKAFPGKDILLVACDMLELKNEILLQLVKEYSKNRDFDFFAFDNAGITEPLCAVYTSKALLSILTEQNRLCGNGSLRKILDSGNTKKLIASHNCSFKNYNTKSDSEI